MTLTSVSTTTSSVIPSTNILPSSFSKLQPPTSSAAPKHVLRSLRPPTTTKVSSSSGEDDEVANMLLISSHNNLSSGTFSERGFPAKTRLREDRLPVPSIPTVQKRGSLKASGVPSDFTRLNSVPTSTTIAPPPSVSSTIKRPTLTVPVPATSSHRPMGPSSPARPARSNTATPHPPPTPTSSNSLAGLQPPGTVKRIPRPDSAMSGASTGIVTPAIGVGKINGGGKERTQPTSKNLGVSGSSSGTVVRNGSATGIASSGGEGNSGLPNQMTARRIVAGIPSTAKRIPNPIGNPLPQPNPNLLRTAVKSKPVGVVKSRVSDIDSTTIQEDSARETSTASPLSVQRLTMQAQRVKPKGPPKAQSAMLSSRRPSSRNRKERGEKVFRAAGAPPLPGMEGEHGEGEGNEDDMLKKRVSMDLKEFMRRVSGEDSKSFSRPISLLQPIRRSQVFRSPSPSLTILSSSNMSDVNEEELDKENKVDSMSQISSFSGYGGNRGGSFPLSNQKPNVNTMPNSNITKKPLPFEEADLSIDDSMDQTFEESLNLTSESFHLADRTPPVTATAKRKSRHGRLSIELSLVTPPAHSVSKERSLLESIPTPTAGAHSTNRTKHRKEGDHTSSSGKRKSGLGRVVSATIMSPSMTPGMEFGFMHEELDGTPSMPPNGRRSALGLGGSKSRPKSRSSFRAVSGDRRRSANFVVMQDGQDMRGMAKSPDSSILSRKASNVSKRSRKSLASSITFEDMLSTSRPVGGVPERAGITKEEEEEIRAKVSKEWEEKMINLQAELEVGRMQIKNLEDGLKSKDEDQEKLRTQLETTKSSLTASTTENDKLMTILDRTRSALETLRTETRQERSTFEVQKKELVSLRTRIATEDGWKVAENWAEVSRKAREERGAVKEGRMVFESVRGELEAWREVVENWIACGGEK